MNKSKGGRINRIFRTLLVALFFCVTGGAFVLAETLPELNQSTEINRIYNFVTDEKATLDSDMGVTSEGMFTVNGLNKDSNTIDFNNYSGFVITKVQTTLNINNLTITGAKSDIGAFLYNVSSDSQVTLTNLNITSNSVNTSGNAYGGAIYTFNPLTLTNVSLKGNSATTTGPDTEARGGAIYARDSINMIADSDNVVIVDNTTADASGTDNNAVYMANSNSTLNIQARNNGQMDIQDNINGASGYRVNITGDGTGTVGLNDSIHNAGEINVSDVNVTMADGKIKNHELNNLNIGDNVNFTIDADLANQTSDTITAQNGQGTLYLTGLNILSSSTENEVKIQILKDAGNIVLNIDNLSSSIYTEVEATMYNSSLLVDSLGLGTTDTTNDSIVITGQKDVLYEMVKDNNPLHTIKNFIFNTTSEYNLTQDLEESPQESILNIYNISTAERGVINANNHSMFKLTNPVTSVTLNDITIKNAHTDNNGSVVSLSNNTATFNATDSTLTNNSADGRGGAIYVNRGTVSLNNTTLSQNSSKGGGGAVYVSNGSVTVNNSAVSENSSEGNGGAISSTGNSTVVLNNNEFRNNTSNARGGAIYTNGTVQINANGGDTTFEGNTDSTGSNAVYGGANGTVILNATNGGNINMNDKISGDTGYRVNITGSSDGNVNLDNNIENANITQTSSSLNLSHDNLLSGNSYHANGGTLNMVNGEIGNTDFSEFTLGGRTNFKADVNLYDSTMDRITSETYRNIAGTVNVNTMHLLSDSRNRRTVVHFADGSLRGHVSTPIKTITSRVYRYMVSYYPSDGNFVFLRGSGNDYRSFDSPLLATSVSQQMAYMNQLQNYQAAMYHNDTYMSLPKNVRLNYLRNGISSTDYDTSQMSHLTIPEEKRSIWVRPYASFESIPLKHGPKVSAINYGTLAGGESDMIQLGHGFTMVYGGFLSYNGNTYHYSNVHSTQQGATIGGIIYLYKGNFFNTLTANVGWMINDNDTEYGSDTMNIIMSGFADKIGYNIEIANGKVIIQPSIMFGYTFVHNSDYTTSNDVKVSSDPLHAIHFIPGIKVIGNLANGWQPYACINIIANFIDKSQITVNDIQLPEMSVDPYVEYGLGIQKRWADKYSGFAQATVRNGGRRGAALLFGFRCMLGKLKTATFARHDDAKPKRIKFKERKKPQITVEKIKHKTATKPAKTKVKKTKERRRFNFNILNIFKREKKKVLYQYNTDVSAKVVTDVYNDGVIIRTLDGMKSGKISVYGDTPQVQTNPPETKGTIETEKDVNVKTTVKNVQKTPVKQIPTKAAESKKTTQKTTVKSANIKSVQKGQKTTVKSSVHNTAKPANKVVKPVVKKEVKPVEKPVTKQTVKPAIKQQSKAVVKSSATPNNTVKQPTKPKTVPQVQNKEQVKTQTKQPVVNKPEQPKTPAVQTMPQQPQAKPLPAEIQDRQADKTQCIKPWTKRLNTNENRNQGMMKKTVKPSTFNDFKLEIIDINF